MAPLEIGKTVSDKTTYSPAIMPERAKALVVNLCIKQNTPSPDNLFFAEKKVLKFSFLGCFIEVLSENLLIFIIYFYRLFCKRFETVFCIDKVDVVCYNVVMKKSSLNTVLSVIYIVAVFLFIITFSIGLPINLRFFYYMQINPLELPEECGYDYATIKAAFDEVMNYLTIPGKSFGTGVFSYTENGAAHFADCKVLFMLNNSVLLLSSAITITLFILNKKGKITLKRPFGMNAAFVSSISIFAVAVILVGLVSIDFDKAFVIFHKIFFPGKDNWLFDPDEDQILQILPQEFFMHSAILIASSIIVITTSIIVTQLIKRKKAKKNLNKSIDTDV